MSGSFEIKVAKDGQFYFHLLAGNGQIILSSEMYTAKASALNGVESVRKNSVLAARFDKLVSSNKKPYFVLKAGNHQVIGQSQMYSSEEARDNGIDSVMKNASAAKLHDLT